MTRPHIFPLSTTLLPTLALVLALLVYIVTLSPTPVPFTRPRPLPSMAYGAIAAPNTGELNLPMLSYNLPNQKGLTTFPLTLETTPLELRETMYSIFAAEIEKGLTYPQRGPTTLESFSAYFYGGGTVIVGLVSGADETEEEGEIDDIPLEEVRAGRDWDLCLGGFFYIKPNYPGRSSHNCNAGFIVNPALRGSRIGSALGKAYLIYAPKLGYRASVFNLVYTNNNASLKIWDSLGFTRAGLIPEAGLLKKQDGSGEEEYVDAVVFYKKFD